MSRQTVLSSVLLGACAVQVKQTSECTQRSRHTAIPLLPTTGKRCQPGEPQVVGAQELNKLTH